MDLTAHGIKCYFCNSTDLKANEYKYYEETDRFICKSCVLRAVTKIATTNGHFVLKPVHSRFEDGLGSCIIPSDLKCTACDAQYTFDSPVQGTLLTSSKCHIVEQRPTRTNCPHCGGAL